mmetsp:Transcript_34196/g.61667  ORF Transcript_34196/g.61667 Transcript_34196/m.61667 type:complete len:335 (-) Transcript_34196:1053-2057(-)
MSNRLVSVFRFSIKPALSSVSRSISRCFIFPSSSECRSETANVLRSNCVFARCCRTSCKSFFKVAISTSYLWIVFDASDNLRSRSTTRAFSSSSSRSVWAFSFSSSAWFARDRSKSVSNCFSWRRVRRSVSRVPYRVAAVACSFSDSARHMRYICSEYVCTTFAYTATASAVLGVTPLIASPKSFGNSNNSSIRNASIVLCTSSLSRLMLSCCWLKSARIESRWTMRSACAAAASCMRSSKISCCFSNLDRSSTSATNLATALWWATRSLSSADCTSARFSFKLWRCARSSACAAVSQPIAFSVFTLSCLASANCSLANSNSAMATCWLWYSFR